MIFTADSPGAIGIAPPIAEPPPPPDPPSGPQHVHDGRTRPSLCGRAQRGRTRVHVRALCGPFAWVRSYADGGGVGGKGNGEGGDALQSRQRSHMEEGDTSLRRRERERMHAERDKGREEGRREREKASRSPRGWKFSRLRPYVHAHSWPEWEDVRGGGVGVRRRYRFQKNKKIKKCKDQTHPSHSERPPVCRR